MRRADTDMTHLHHRPGGCGHTRLTASVAVTSWNATTPHAGPGPARTYCGASRQQGQRAMREATRHVRREQGWSARIMKIAVSRSCGARRRGPQLGPRSFDRDQLAADLMGAETLSQSSTCSVRERCKSQAQLVHGGWLNYPNAFRSSAGLHRSVRETPAHSVGSRFGTPQAMTPAPRPRQSGRYGRSDTDALPDTGLVFTRGAGSNHPPGPP